MSSATEAPTNGTEIPAWVEAALFEPVFREIYPDFQQTKNFKAKKALGGGENYATIMLRLEADIELKDGSSKTLTLMLKTAHDSELFRQFMETNNIFEVEAAMYKDIVPEFEQMYKDVGLDVTFGAKSYVLSTDQPYILLEDLKPRGFVNINRLEGLDMDHTHSVLKKLAQWHAASASRVACKGAFPASVSVGFFKDECLEMMKGMFSSITTVLLECMKTYDGHELYYDRMIENRDNQVQAFFDAGKADASEFNVLNHGDCWSNNVMFKHDAFGKIKEAYLVDFQMPHYGSPAQDLYYFLLSSTKYELKIKHFDHFIKYYHDQLLEHLKLLNYPKKMPTLKDIHIMLHKYNAWAMSTVNGVMAAVLLDPCEDANMDNFVGEDDAGMQLKIKMYSNARYRKHAEMILPWLYNRGAI